MAKNTTNYVSKEALGEYYGAQSYFSQDNPFRPIWSYKDYFRRDNLPHQKWYEKKEDSEPIIQQLISSVTPRRFIKSSDFLTVIQAIEGYYNRFVKDDVGLRKMLSCLYESYSDVSIIINNKPEVNQVVDSRHYYSHNLPDGKKDSVCKGFELSGLAEKLKPLLIGCALTLIGFGNNEIEESLQNYYNRNGNVYIKTK